MANTIALVDDDRNILTSVSMALEAEGFAVRCYADGAEALKGLNGQPVDVAVLDIKMPRMDGMELLAQLRRTSPTPVIFLTSKDDEVDELLGLRMGADDYIKKPFSQRLLIERIRALLRRGELARGSILAARSLSSVVIERQTVAARCPASSPSKSASRLTRALLVTIPTGLRNSARISRHCRVSRSDLSAGW